MWVRDNFAIAKTNSYRFCLFLTLFSVSFLCSMPILASDDVQTIQTELIDEKKSLKQAEKLTKQGELVKAVELLNKVIRQNQNNIKAKLQLSHVYLKARRYVDSYNISYEIAKNDNKNARAYALLGGAYLGAGNFKDASLCFQQAALLDDDDSLARAGMGMLLYYENRIQESLTLLNDAVFLEPDEPDYLFAQAQVSARAEKYKEAAAAYRKFMQIAPNSDKERKERIKGLIGFLEYLGNKSGLYRLSGEQNSTVLIELKRDRPIIGLKIGNTKEELKFVLDTGSGISVISEETAKRLKVKTVSRGGYARAVGGNGKFEIVYGFLKSIKIGEVQIENVPVYIRKFHEENNNADGYIGLSLISKFLTTLDYQAKTFSLSRQRKGEVIEANENNVVLPLRLTSSGFLSGEVKLQGIESPLNFIVDTGASISVISNDLANSSEINRHITDNKMRVIGAAGITEDVPSFLLPKVSFGNHAREKITAIALNLEMINEASGFEQAGILGGNFLKNYRLTFDFNNAKVKFEPNSTAKVE
ncbi:MAG: aspartyl protease family protein [Pyrinomonadaceae bacterium]|nr:aspartyl protease family protein [Pyrinomonadaceae bacterium]